MSDKQQPGTVGKIGKAVIPICFWQIPNAAVLWTFRDQIQTNPYVTIGSALYLFLATFVLKVWRELEADLVKGTANRIQALPGAMADVLRRTLSWLKAAITCRSPGFRKRYLREMIFEYGLFNDRGLGLINANRLDLEKVYVELRASASPAGHSEMLVANEDRPERLREGTHAVWQFLRDIQRSDHPLALAIIGAPGSGKTTLLRHVLMVLAKNRQRKYRLRARLPVLLELRRVQKEITRRKKDLVPLEEVIEKHLADTKAYPGLNGSIPKGWFQRELRRGGCLILLDGLDEVASDETRKFVSEWVDNQLRRDIGRKNVFVVTSRPQGYKSAPLERAQLLEVQPFAPGQVYSFVRAWYLASEIVSSGNKDNAEVRRRATKESSDLIDRLTQAPSLYDLTSNPLLLTMISMVHRYSGALPGSRVQLYQSVCKALLESWRQSRDLKDDFTGDQKESVLRPLARHMMESNIREIAHADALPIITPAMTLIGVKPERFNGFLKELQAGSGLLLEKEAGVWSFAHLSFQEYLTATDWVNDPPSDGDWPDKVAQPWWRETLLLYSAQADASGIVTACLDAGSPQSFALALDVDRMSQTLAPDVRERLQTTLHDALRSRNVEIFQPAAEAMLIQSQQDYIPLGDEAAISARPVTQAEYQLFLLEDLKTAPLRKPFHWADSWFSDAPDSVVVGMRPKRADEYCRALDGRFPAWKHRLPAPDELDRVTNGEDWQAWCDDGRGFHLSAEEGALSQQLISWQSKIGSLKTVPVTGTDSISNILARARALDHVHALALALAFARALDLDLDLDRDRALALDLDLGFARALDRARDFALDRIRDLANNIARDLNRDLAEAEARVRIRAGDLARTLRQDRERAIESRDEAILSGNSYNARRLTELVDLHDVIASESVDETLRNWRQYLMHILEFDLKSENGTIITRAAAGFSRFLPWKRRKILTHDAITEERRLLYAFLKVIDARERGELPAWEAIRVVREPATNAE